MPEENDDNSAKKLDRRSFLSGSAGLGISAALMGLSSASSNTARAAEGQKSILMDNSLCIECQACRVACQNENEIDEEYSFIKFLSWEEGQYPDVEYRVRRDSCFHCPDSPCINQCPVDALYKGEGQFTTLEVEECIACGQCEQVCPFDIPEIGEERMYKCDACQHLVAQGEEPACVSTCISYALDYGDFDEMLEKGQQRVEELKEDYPGAELYSSYDFGLLLILTSPADEMELI